MKYNLKYDLISTLQYHTYHKYYPTTPKIPYQQIITNQDSNIWFL